MQQNTPFGFAAIHHPLSNLGACKETTQNPKRNKNISPAARLKVQYNASESPSLDLGFAVLSILQRSRCNIGLARCYALAFFVCVWGDSADVSAIRIQHEDLVVRADAQNSLCCILDVIEHHDLLGLLCFLGLLDCKDITVLCLERSPKQNVVVRHDCSIVGDVELLTCTAMLGSAARNTAARTRVNAPS